MARTKKINYFKLSVEDFIQTYNETVEKLNEMEEVAKSLNLKIRRPGESGTYYSAPSVQADQTFSQYVRTPTTTPTYSEQSQLNNLDAVGDLDLIVTPLEPGSPSRETFKGSAVADLAEPGIPVDLKPSKVESLSEVESPISQLEAIEKSINNRLLELENTQEGLDVNI